MRRVGRSISLCEDTKHSSDSVYYVRAVEASSPQVNGDPLRCERDPAGMTGERNRRTT